MGEEAGVRDPGPLSQKTMCHSLKILVEKTRADKPLRWLTGRWVFSVPGLVVEKFKGTSLGIDETPKGQD